MVSAGALIVEPSKGPNRAQREPGNPCKGTERT